MYIYTHLFQSDFTKEKGVAVLTRCRLDHARSMNSSTQWAIIEKA